MRRIGTFRERFNIVEGKIDTCESYAFTLEPNDISCTHCNDLDKNSRFESSLKLACRDLNGADISEKQLDIAQMPEVYKGAVTKPLPPREPMPKPTPVVKPEPKPQPKPKPEPEPIKEPEPEPKPKPEPEEIPDVPKPIEPEPLKEPEPEPKPKPVQEVTPSKPLQPQRPMKPQEA